MKKRIIWLTGSMSSGKSTQRRNLCNTFIDGKIIEHKGTKNGMEYHFTSFGSISCLGKVRQIDNGEISPCDGLDSVFGNLKKDGAIATIDLALEQSKIVVIEGSQTSPSWGELMQPILKKHDADLYLIHLYMTYEQNFKRLKERHVAKLNVVGTKITVEEHQLTDKQIESLIGKLRQFNACYEKIKHLCKRLRIDATRSEKYILEDIINFCFKDCL